MNTPTHCTHLTPTRFPHQSDRAASPVIFSCLLQPSASKSTMATQKQSINTMPDDVLRSIMDCLSIPALCTTARTCKLLHQPANKRLKQNFVSTAEFYSWGDRVYSLKLFMNQSVFKGVLGGIFHAYTKTGKPCTFVTKFEYGHDTDGDMEMMVQTLGNGIARIYLKNSHNALGGFELQATVRLRLKADHSVALKPSGSNADHIERWIGGFSLLVEGQPLDKFCPPQSRASLMHTKRGDLMWSSEVHSECSQGGFLLMRPKPLLGAHAVRWLPPGGTWITVWNQGGGKYFGLVEDDILDKMKDPCFSSSQPPFLIASEDEDLWVRDLRGVEEAAIYEGFIIAQFRNTRTDEEFFLFRDGCFGRDCTGVL